MILEKGQVIKSTGSLYTITTKDRKTFECTISGRFRLEGLKSTNPVAVGDWVVFEITEKDKTGRITEVLERKNYIIRKASNLSKTYQVIAANVDQLVLLVTVAYPQTYPEFIDRYLVSAEAYSIPSILVFNKIDLYDIEQNRMMEELISIYQNIGYPCYRISATKKTNLVILKRKMKDKLNLISGVSGTGKSTLINALDPQLQLKTREISDYHERGKHTTTFAEMFELNFGSYVIDTPGIKGFGIIDMENEPIFHYFPEIFKLSKDCKYYNCLHINEPQCAVIQALQTGELSYSRYKSYLSLVEEQSQATKYRK